MILYGSEHQTRAANLATKVNEQCAAVTAYTGAGAIPACKDKSLTIWGHGGPDSFAELAPAALKDLVARWKARNAELTAVELVTCDARHLEGDTDSYTDKLMPLVIGSGKPLVTVRTLPRGGSKATWSTLWASTAAGVDGYYFVAGETQDAMNQGAQVLKDAYQKTNADPSIAAADKFMAALPIAKAVNDKKAQQGGVAYVTSAGSFTGLRDRLVPVTAYSKDGKIVAVPK